MVCFVLSLSFYYKATKYMFHIIVVVGGLNLTENREKR